MTKEQQAIMKAAQDLLDAETSELFPSGEYHWLLEAILAYENRPEPNAALVQVTPFGERVLHQR